MFSIMNQTQTWQTDWQAAIARVYEEFAACRRPSVMDVAPHRDAAAILRDLSSAPLAELTEERLGPYAGWALTTVGNESDYKHFLPRIIALMAEPTSHIGLDPLIVADKLNYADFCNWPVEQRAVLRNAFRAALSMIYRQPRGTLPVSELLIANALIDNDIQVLLDGLLPATTLDTVLNLADLIREAATDMERFEVDWSTMPKSDRIKLRAWVASEAVSQALTAGIELVDEDDAWEIEAAFDLLTFQ